MAEKRAQTPAGTTINHDKYDEALDADDVDDDLIDVGDDTTGRPSLQSARLTLDSVRPSLIRAAGAAGALAGAGAHFSDNVTLESMPQNGPYKYESRLPDDTDLGLRPSDESFDFTGQTGIAPPDWRLESRPVSEEGDEDEDDEGKSSPADSEDEGYTYDPSLYSALPVSPLIKNLFPQIMECAPKKVKMGFKLIPFHLEMVPAIGDIDPFIKSKWKMEINGGGGEGGEKEEEEKEEEHNNLTY